jgi:mono/diheme cytochrome c family protein
MFIRATRANMMKLASMAMGVAVIGACGATQSGATDANVATASANASEGARLFGQQCTRCHGQRGEGTSAPTIMGPGGLPTYPRATSLSTNPAYSDPSELQLREALRPAGAPKRDPFNTAADVYNYISKRMPIKAPGSLKSEEYWAILNFMLIAHGVAVPQGGVTAANASTVAVTPK